MRTKEQWYQHLRVLYIIIDTPLDLQLVNDGRRVQPRWGLENVKGGSFVWNYECGGFEYREGEEAMERVLYELLQGISRKLGEELLKNKTREFEVRPVVAARKFG
jgi:hypothetical protein